MNTIELKAIFEHFPSMLFVVDDERKIMTMSALARNFVGARSEDVSNLHPGEALGCIRALDDPRGCGFGRCCVTCPLRLAIQDALQDGITHTNITFEPGLVGGEPSEGLCLLAATSRVCLSGQTMVLISFEDFTERKRNENIMGARLRLTAFASTHSMDELLTATLDEIEVLTGSKIGFFHFVEPDQKTLSLQNWSTNTLKNMCTAVGKGSHYGIEQAGVWVECVHLSNAVIHNDYASLPGRKGMPEGHAPVIREVVVPIFRGNLIKAIIGVGNKPSDYDEKDIETVSQLADLAWDIAERKRAEESLRASEEKFRRVFEESFDGLFITSPGGRILDMNRTGVALFGYDSKEEVLSLDLAKDVYANPSDRTRILELVNSQGAAEYEIVVKKKNGDRIVTLCSLTAQRDLNGIPISYRGIIRDITEHKRTEEALKASESNYRRMIETSTEGVWWIDDRHRTIYVNHQMAEILGLTPEEMIGRTLDEFVIDADLHVLGEQMKARSALNNGRYELRLRHRDGHVVWCHVSASAVADATGDFAGSFAMLTDITIRKQTEEKSREGEQRFRTVADFTYDWEYWMGADGTLQYVSPSCLRITGHEPREFLEDPDLFHRIIHPDDLARVMEHHDDHQRPQDSQHLEYRIIRPDGEIVWIGHECNRVVDGEGRDLGVRASNRDITNLKAGQAALLAANAQLQSEHAMLESKNIALREILDHIQEERDQIRAQVTANKEKLIVPLLRNLKTRLGKEHESQVTLVERALDDIASPFADTVSRKFANLSPRELEVCAMIKNGLLTKEIADCLGVSLETVRKFRQRIRYKLDIANRDVDTAEYLRSL